MTDCSWSIEVIKDFDKRRDFKFALLDFDGTISLIREGWQQIMIPYFIEVLMDTPKHLGYDETKKCVDEFTLRLASKQTIYKFIKLSEEVAKRGGSPSDPFFYKDEYQKRLLEKIKYRLDGLERGHINPYDMVVPGAIELLRGLRERNIIIILTSDTDEEQMLTEADLLGITSFCSGGIYSSDKDYKNFFTKMVVEKILKQNNLRGEQLVGFGDGYVETEAVSLAGGFAVGVASNETTRTGIDDWKQEQLIKAGANIIIPDYKQTDKLFEFLDGTC